MVNAHTGARHLHGSSLEIGLAALTATQVAQCELCKLHNSAAEQTRRTRSARAPYSGYFAVLAAILRVMQRQAFGMCRAKRVGTRVTMPRRPARHTPMNLQLP